LPDNNGGINKEGPRMRPWVIWAYLVTELFIKKKAWSEPNALRGWWLSQLLFASS
jgi:hypothetical protein